MFESLTPRASQKARLFIASLAWTLIGVSLFAMGVHWIVWHTSAIWLAALPVALIVGWAKGRFILLPRAEANARRILERGDRQCIGGIFSWESWALAVGMMVLGITLRHSSLPRTWLGVIYSTVGTALLTASVGSWRFWRRSVAPPKP